MLVLSMVFESCVIVILSFDQHASEQIPFLLFILYNETEISVVGYNHVIVLSIHMFAFVYISV